MSTKVIHLNAAANIPYAYLTELAISIGVPEFREVPNPEYDEHWEADVEMGEVENPDDEFIDVETTDEYRISEVQKHIQGILAGMVSPLVDMGTVMLRSALEQDQGELAEAMRQRDLAVASLVSVTAAVVDV